jgi:hypothetical protein
MSPLVEQQAIGIVHKQRHPIGFLHNLHQDVCKAAPCPQDCLLSFITHMRYTYTRMVFPIPTPSSARRIGIGREGVDL